MEVKTLLRELARAWMSKRPNYLIKKRVELNLKQLSNKSWNNL